MEEREAGHPAPPLLHHPAGREGRGVQEVPGAVAVVTSMELHQYPDLRPNR